MANQPIKRLTNIKAQIRDAALAAGFHAIGFAPAQLNDETRARLQTFLANGYHGSMDWLAARVDQRGDPQRLWPEARTVISFAMNYAPAHNPTAILHHKSKAAISVYAQGDDYHHVLKKELRRLATWIEHKFKCKVKIFTDTAPVMEKPLAQAAGLGWQGKHTNVVSRTHGSWLFLGEIFTTLDVEHDTPETDRCGNCRACLDVCPTNAFVAPYQLDARRCISYLTIEHDGVIDDAFKPLLGNRIYGCDDCLAVCPWNKFAQVTDKLEFRPRTWATPTASGTPSSTSPLQGEENNSQYPASSSSPCKGEVARAGGGQFIDAPELAELAQLDDTAFRARFSKSPIKRIGVKRFLRNVMIAMGNSGNATLRVHAERYADDADDGLRDAARWAAARLV